MPGSAEQIEMMSTDCQLQSSGKQDWFKINMYPTGDKNAHKSTDDSEAFCLYHSSQSGKMDICLG